MAELNKVLHIKKGSTEQSVKLYTTVAEVGTPYMYSIVDGVQAYIPLGTESDSRASLGRVKEHDGTKFAILTSGKPPYHMDSYTEVGTYTWTCPRGVTQVRVTLAGGGGGGVATAQVGNLKFYSASGGRGEKITTTHPVSSGNTYSVVVGGGGEGKTVVELYIYESGKAGDGSPSSFDTLSAKGGGGGTHQQERCTQGTSYGEGGEGGTAWSSQEGETKANAGKAGWVNVEYGGDI